MNFEDQLRSALQPTEPPAGFADRVLARTRQRRPARYRFATWAAAAALLAVTLGVEYSRRVQGERARDQALYALDIAAHKLHDVQLKIEKAQALDNKEKP